MNWIKPILICFILAFLLPLASFGQADGRGGTLVETPVANVQGNTYAIIVGISEYPQLKPLSYADDDALLFKEFLMSEAGNKTPESHIKLFLNKEATAPNFWLTGINWLMSKKPAQGDRVYIYLAGHGDAISSEEYFFLTYDCEPGNDKNNYMFTGNVQLYNLKMRIKQLTAAGAEVALIMDACRTGDIPGGTEGLSYFSESVVEKQVGEMIMLSAGPNQFAFEDKAIGGGHGLFTYYLVKGLSGEADMDMNGDISMLELQMYTMKEVTEKARVKFNKTQVPQFCCPQFQMTNLAKTDETFADYLTQLEQFEDYFTYNDGLTSTGRSAESIDNAELASWYQLFSTALENETFKGDSAAEIFLDKMEEICADCDLINEAKYSLAAAYLNYGQARINLFASGKDAKTIELTKNSIEKKGNLLDTKLTKLEKLANTSFKDAAGYMHSAFELLDNDSFYVDMYQGKYAFLDLISRIYEVETSESEYWINTVDSALALDSNAYMFHVAGMVYSQLALYEQSILYYGKALVKAPKWIYPIYNVGLILSNIGTYELANEFYKLVIEIDSTYYKAYYGMGTAYYLNEQFDSAAIYFNKVLSIDSTVSEAYNNLGLVYHFSNQLDLAEKYYLLSIDHNSYSSSTLYNLGVLYYDQQDFERAKKYYLLSLNLYPDYEDALNNLGLSYYALEQNDSARICFEKVLSLDPGYIMAYNNIGLLYNAAEQYDSAAYFYQRALDIQPDYIKAYANLASLMKDMGDMDSALFYYTRIVEISPENDTAHHQLGYAYHEVEDYKNAIWHYQKAISLNGNLPEYYTNIGVAYEDQNIMDSAIYFYNESIRVDSNYSLAYYNLGRCFSEDLDYEKSNSYHKKAIELGRKPAKAYNLIALNYYYQDQYDSALLYYEKALEVDSTFSSAYYNMGLVYDDRDEFDKAVEVYKKAIDLFDEDADYHYNLGLAYFYQELYDSAISAFQIALDLDSSYYLANYNMGLSFYYKNEFEPAGEQFKKTLTKYPYADAAYNLGLIYASSDYDTSTFYYKKCLEIDSDYKYAYYQIGSNFMYSEIYDSSVYYFNEMLAFDSLDVDAWYMLAIVYHEMGLNESSHEAFELLLELTPDDPWTLNDYAYFLALDSSRLDEAEQMITRALSADSSNIYYLDTYAYVLFNLGKYEQAKQWLNKAIDLAEMPMVDLHEHLGDVQFKLGQEEQALESWIQAKEAGGDSEVLLKKIEEKRYIRELE